ncbi:AIPR family protein [Sphingopyxis sp. BSNA05]|uniref:AIPR family protein n=1 Tax=Sphingopyxis sp. BSNA05 TaxID=1236614 RepID=UPI001C26B8FC|nr:AIPR family protein [Sphingopyxis sp. BSNA05]
MAGAEANSAFQLAEFMEAFAEELMETGFIEGFEFCHFRTARGIRIDGYWFNDEGGLDLFIADFESRLELASLTQTDVNALFKRATNFYEASKDKNLYSELEETSPEYGLSRDIADRKSSLQKVNFFILSERVLSDRLQALESNEIDGVSVSYHVWGVSRLQRQRSSRGHKEALDIDFLETFGAALPCLPAHVGSASYQSFLIVIPGEMLASLYGRYGARLLEQNVRSFLQARGKVNKGIRGTILNEPDMFFAYNNGITATAQAVETQSGDGGLEIVRLVDLQIVNGGQTTASLFHTQRKDKASLERVFVQMKLSVIPTEAGEEVVPKISEYANTQNRVNAADFFSNHPFHIRIEEFSRRIWAPAQQGAQRETKWFYERARGQYADAQSKLTQGEKRRFQAEYPKPQMFTKTDLAKFENVWDDDPKWVNLGAQKNFARYAARIGKEWNQAPDRFNEWYYRRAVARAIVFRAVEKLVSAQPWYNGGYRANIVAYALAIIGKCCEDAGKKLNFQAVWEAQSLPASLENALVVAAKYVNDDISRPPEGISNISEWCKKDGCWLRLTNGIDKLTAQLDEDFWSSLVTEEQAASEAKAARKTQKIDNGIDAQKEFLIFQLRSGWKFETLAQRRRF